jgi:hypothetical protein
LEFEECDPEPWEFCDDDGYPLPWTYDDGGRAAIAPNTDDGVGDCVARAIAIATGRPHAEVYDMVDKFGRAAGYLGITCRGVPYELTELLMAEITGRRANLITGDLPDEPQLIAVMGNHMCAVMDGVIRDVRDCVWEDDEHEQRVSVEGVYLPPGELDAAGEIPRASRRWSSTTRQGPLGHDLG